MENQKNLLVEINRMKEIMGIRVLSEAVTPTYVKEFLEKALGVTEKQIDNLEKEGVAKGIEKIELSTKTRNGKKFYLGLYWLDNPKNKLTAKTRHKLWKNWYADQSAESKSPCGEILCPCCEETYISSFNFEAGHKTSFKYGGTDDLSNLIPICSGCNRSMGIMNYDEYRNTL